LISNSAVAFFSAAALRVGVLPPAMLLATGGGAEADDVDLPKLPAATAHAARRSNGK
jgi:hypothetical protein